MTSHIIALALAPLLVLKKRRLERLSQHLMRAQRPDDQDVLRGNIAFLHLSIGSLLSRPHGAGHQNDPLWRHLQLGAECYEKIRIGDNAAEHHRVRSIFYQRSGKVTMRMADRHKDRSLRDIAEQRLSIAEESARLSGSPQQRDNVRALQYHLRQIDLRPVTIQVRLA